MNLTAVFDRYNLEKQDIGSGTRVLISGRYGGCVSMYTPDELDDRALQYAQHLAKTHPQQVIYAADLGASPYCPQSIRFAHEGLHVDAFDLEPPAAQFAEINQEFDNRIRYVQKNLVDVTSTDLHPYSMVYTNRCLFYLPFHEAKKVLRQFIDQALPGAQFFISLMDMNGPLAINYPDRDKPVDERFAIPNCDYARLVECNMPVCFYYADEVESELLHDLPIRILELIQLTPRSIKVVFEVKPSC